MWHYDGRFSSSGDNSDSEDAEDDIVARVWRNPEKKIASGRLWHKNNNNLLSVTHRSRDPLLPKEVLSWDWATYLYTPCSKLLLVNLTLFVTRVLKVSVLQ